MAPLGMAAADIGVLGFNLVHKPLFHQEIERPVDGRRSHLGTRLAVFLSIPLHFGKDVIGANRRMALPDKLQHPSAGRGNPDTAFGAEPLSGPEGVFQTPAMVVIRFGKAVAGM